MIDYFFLIPIALGLGLLGLTAFMWTLKSGQYDDLDGAAERILFENASVIVHREDPALRRRDSWYALPASNLLAENHNRQQQR